MIKIFSAVFLCLSMTTVHAQMSESEVSEMCMNQILAGLSQDKVLGPESGLCVKLNKDESGNISGMDFNMQSSAFALGKDNLQDEETKARLATIKQLVLDYQKTVTKNPNLQIDDIDIQVKSFADGVGGPTGYDLDIKKARTWGDLNRLIGADQKSMEYLHQVAPKSNNPASPVNFDGLDSKAQSIIRNIVLGKKRSEEICRQFGMKNCNKKENAGFASPDLEKAPKEKRNCPERRVSVIKVNLTKAAQITMNGTGEFHPAFQIPADAQYKKDLQTAATFQIFKKHKETIEKFKDPANIEAERQKALKPPMTDKKQKILQALNAWNPRTLSILDLPEKALESSEYADYAAMMSSFSVRYNNARDALALKSKDLQEILEQGNFIKFKEECQKGDAAKKALCNSVLHNISEYSGGADPDTDLLNYFPSGQAMQYHFMKQSGSPYLASADQFMSQSNANLDIKFSNIDFHGNTPNKNKPVVLGCHGGCQTGIKENPATGEMITDFRNPNLDDKNASQMVQEFQSPTSFGAMKSLSVYAIKNCANCGCLKDPNVSMDSVLSDQSRTTRTTVNKMTKNPADGTRSFTQSAGTIENPHTTCLFTPPVAHTCKVKPEAAGNGHTGFKPKPNYACPFYDKTSHGLKWTTNFMKEALSLAENSSQQVCDVKITSLKDQAKAAECAQSEPDDVPVSCQ